MHWAPLCVYTASSKTPPCVSSLRLVGISPDVLPCSHFPPGQQSVHSRSHANVECVVGWQLFFPAHPSDFMPASERLLKVLGGDGVMFLYSEIKDNPVLYNSP